MQKMRNPSTGHFINSEPSLQPLAYCSCYPLLVTLILVEDWDHLVLCAFSHQHQTHTDVTIISFVGEHKHWSLERRQGKTHSYLLPCLVNWGTKPQQRPDYTGRRCHSLGPILKFLLIPISIGKHSWCLISLLTPLAVRLPKF